LKENILQISVLADFIADWISPTYVEEAPIEPWVIYCDGAWCKDGVGVLAIIESPSGVKIRYAARLNFTKLDPSTNNTTEYGALLLGLCKMKALGHQNFTERSDSKVISDHNEKESDAQSPE
jgi:ribonuclease HI